MFLQFIPVVSIYGFRPWGGGQGIGWSSTSLVTLLIFSFICQYFVIHMCVKCIYLFHTLCKLSSPPPSSVFYWNARLLYALYTVYTVHSVHCTQCTGHVNLYPSSILAQYTTIVILSSRLRMHEGSG